MKKSIQTDANGVDSFDRAEKVLASYPHITQVQIDELKRWWKKDASAFDIANLASKNHIENQYRQFRKDHIDGLQWKDLFLGILFIVIILAIVAVMMNVS